MYQVFNKIIEKLEELKKLEREDLCDLEGCVDGEEIYEDGKSAGRYEQTVRIMEIVKQESAEYNNGWIPCSERLPETSGFYLVSTVTGVVGSVSYYIEQESRVMHTSLGTAIAWQPLPEPYRTKEE